MTWDEHNLADLLVSRWPDALGLSCDERGRVHGHPVAWRLWTRMPGKPKAPPIVVCVDLAHVVGDRCVAFTDVEVAMLFAASEEGHCDAERLVEIARARQTAMGEARVSRLRWLDVCELAGVRWQDALVRSRRSLGVALAALGLEAVRVEARGERAEARAA